MIGIICIITAVAAHAETVTPLKISRPDIAGEIFQRKDADQEIRDGNSYTDVVTYTSKDSTFQTGFYKSGPFHEEIKAPDGYPDDEFLYFISGSVTLTSSDGSVVVVNAGEAVTLPKGWTGTFDTQGYTKMYVIHSPERKF
ncbi:MULTISPECIES: cupin domain-containing protein [unclassified Sinorhizobium]|uniref:cupin domain-containing protein n=1 Tax=unclassified Sinorhizobium TaxID=2613772 RepID=UPI00352368D7